MLGAAFKFLKYFHKTKNIGHTHCLAKGNPL